MSIYALHCPLYIFQLNLYFQKKMLNTGRMEGQDVAVQNITKKRHGFFFLFFKYLEIPEQDR